MSSFGERLKAEREKKGYNQREFAEAIDVTPTRLNYWEKDKREPDFPNIRKMIDVLGCNADYLLGTKFSISDSKEVESCSIATHDSKKSLVAAKAETEDERLKEIIVLYNGLNEEGQERLYDQAQMLSQQSKFKKCVDDNQIA